MYVQRKYLFWSIFPKWNLKQIILLKKTEKHLDSWLSRRPLCVILLLLLLLFYLSFYPLANKVRTYVRPYRQPIYLSIHSIVAITLKLLKPTQLIVMLIKACAQCENRSVFKTRLFVKRRSINDVTRKKLSPELKYFLHTVITIRKW